MNFRILLLAPLAAAVLSVSAASLRVPQGWFASKIANPVDNKSVEAVMNGYEAGLDPAAGGPPTLTLRSVYPQQPWPLSSASVHQSLIGYAGKRVRFSGELRAEAVRGWAGLYLGEGMGDLMSAISVASNGDKPLPRGSAVPADGGWHTVSVVFELSAQAAHLGLGLGLVGEGQVWARDLRFEIVGPEVAPTPTPVGVDLEAQHRFFEKARAETAALPPAPLKNAALD